MRECLKEKELRRICYKTGEKLMAEGKIQEGSEVLVHGSRLLRMEIEKKHFGNIRGSY